jgi:hypothetical protein
MNEPWRPLLDSQYVTELLRSCEAGDEDAHETWDDLVEAYATMPRNYQVTAIGVISRACQTVMTTERIVEVTKQMQSAKIEKSPSQIFSELPQGVRKLSDDERQEITERVERRAPSAP